MTKTKNGKTIDIQQERDGTYSAFLEGKSLAWTGAVSSEQALFGLKTLYPDEIP